MEHSSGTAQLDTAQNPPLFLTDPDEIQAWLDKFIVIEGAYTIDKAGHIHVDGDVTYNSKHVSLLRHFAVKFATVTGTFKFSRTALRSLIGSPEQCQDFYCGDNAKLTSFIGAPKLITGSFYGQNCVALQSLEGSPIHVEGSFYCHTNPCLIDLKGSPQYVGDVFHCADCKNLRTLKGITTNIGGSLYCGGCQYLMNLTDGPESINGFVNIHGGHPYFNFGYLPKGCSCIDFKHIQDPEPYTVKYLLQKKMRILTTQKSKWIALVNRYYRDDDLLTAISGFEKLYNVPFSSVVEKTPEHSGAPAPCMSF